MPGREAGEAWNLFTYAPAVELREDLPRPTMNHETLLLICIALIALAMCTQAIVLLAIFVGIGKAAKSIKQDVGEIKSSVLPVLGTTRDLFTRLAPKVESTVTDVAELAKTFRAQAADVEVSVGQLLTDVRKQTTRVDSMLTGALDALDKASAYVVKTVGKPVRQLSGIMASLKAFVEAMGGPSRSGNSHHRTEEVADDRDLFV
jgi:uncharacterized protein YoxC